MTCDKDFGWNILIKREGYRILAKKAPEKLSWTRLIEAKPIRAFFMRRAVYVAVK